MSEIRPKKTRRRTKRPPSDVASGELFDITAKLHTAPCVPALRSAVAYWRAAGYPGATATTRRLLSWWFERDHALNGIRFAYHRAQREAIETLIYVWECERVRSTYELIAKWGTGVPNIDPPQGVDLTRYCTKMATGSGKTKVISLAIAWQYLNAMCEETNVAAEYARTFLVIAPNVIVLERLKTDFLSGRTFKADPVIPKELRPEWQLDCVIRGEGERAFSDGMLFVTNIQQLYETTARSGSQEPDPIAAIMGTGRDTNGREGGTFADRVVAHGGPLLVINDEAHHTHDAESSWMKVVHDLRKKLPVVAQLDFSATPRFPQGGVFPWTISDYPLKQAIVDQVVKRPMRGVAHIEETRSSQASIRYQGYLIAGVERWREYRQQLSALDKKPILFIMLNDTSEADDVADWLRVRYPELLGGDQTLTIHTDVSGEVSKADLDRARRLAREVDEQSSPVSAIVSVLMLREGWDVQNVTVVVGLRPFSAKARILPEQAIGRGLRLMFRGLAGGYRERVDIIGNPKFLEFVDELERLEDVQFERFDLEKDHVEVITVCPTTGRAEYDISLPILTPTLMRKRHIGEQIEELDVSKLNCPIIPLQWEKGPRRTFRFEGYDVITFTKELEREYEIALPQTAEEVIGFYARRIAEAVKLPSQFALLAPKVREFFELYAFGHAVDLADESVVRAMATPFAHFVMLKTFTDALGSIAISAAEPKLLWPERLLSRCPPFPWSQTLFEAEHTTFNFVPCQNEFERVFAQFLDKAPDVRAFARIPSNFGFAIEYLDDARNLRFYYPDFVATAKDDFSVLLETTTRETKDSRGRIQAALHWCENASHLTKRRWMYRRILQREFHGLIPKNLRDLLTSGDENELIARLIEVGQVGEARKTITDLTRSVRGFNPWPSLLAEPLVKRVASRGRGDFLMNNNWLHDHRREYLGQWVALRDGRLLAADLSRAEVVSRLEKAGSIEGALIVKVER